MASRTDADVTRADRHTTFQLELMVYCIAGRSRCRLICAVEGARDQAIGSDVGLARCRQRNDASRHVVGKREARKVDRLASDRTTDCDRAALVVYEFHLDCRTGLRNGRGVVEHPRLGWQL